MQKKMSDKFLSQEEIDSLLQKNQDINEDVQEDLSDSEKDILGEVGNISMSTAATTLSTLLNRQVDITTPRVQVTTFDKILETSQIPYVILQVQFEDGLHGTNVLMMSIKDASIIANLMMGGDGTEFNEETLSELELSAVSETMNQMIGSASTAVSTMLGKRIDIDPPLTQVGDQENKIQIKGLPGDAPLGCIVFKMTIGNLIDSEIMQLYELKTAKEIANTMIGSISSEEEKQTDEKVAEPSETADFSQTAASQEKAETKTVEVQREAPKVSQENIEVQRPEFVPLKETRTNTQSRNIDLILDVPLNMSVILGRTQRSIKDVLSLEPGSIVELDKYAEEPLEIYVNGKLIAEGEVVVLDEKFGIRINSIVSTKERVETLK